MKTNIPLFLLVVLISEASCGSSSQKMQTLGDELRRLTAAVQGEVSADPAGTAGLSDRELLARATAHDPALLEPFDGYSVRTSREGDYIAVLVCTPDGKRGLLEDTNCTVALDRQLWRDAPEQACQSTVRLADVCKIK